MKGLISKEKLHLVQYSIQNRLLLFLIDLNECSPNPCQNGGICLDGNGDFTCECSAGWTGNKF